MSYEHLYDICPADEGNGMVDSIELRAVSVLAKFADGKISCDDFGDEMMRIGEELNKQMEDCDGNIVIDASVPQWLIMFMGNKFSKWNMMRMQINAARQNPKITSDPRWSEVEKMVSCEFCEVYVPVSEAVERSGKIFCSHEHSVAYFARKRSS